MSLSSRPTQRSTTQRSYLRRARDLLRQCRRDLELPPHAMLDYRRFVGWMITKKPDWSRATWRQYKAAAMYFLEQEARGEETVAPAAARAVDILMPQESDGCMLKTRRTSGSKKKRFTLSDYQRLVADMREHQSRWAEDTERWLGATYLTGLRPSEWRGSDMVSLTLDGAHVDALKVRNGKNSNQRAHGVYRHIILDGLTQEEKTLLKEHIARAKEWDQAGQYESFQRGCASALAAAHRRLWPKRREHATLYSVRHQFSANAKASGLTRAEVAALMGHAADDTAARHYGRKKSGRDMVRVRAHPEEVAKIRLVYEGLPPAPHPKAAPTVKPTLQPRDSDS